MAHQHKPNVTLLQVNWIFFELQQVCSVIIPFNGKHGAGKIQQIQAGIFMLKHVHAPQGVVQQNTQQNPDRTAVHADQYGLLILLQNVFHSRFHSLYHRIRTFATFNR